MNSLLPPALALLLVACLSLTGCASSGAGSATQASQSVARAGDTEAVVLRQMGNPDRREEQAGTVGGLSVWTYENYLQRRTAPETTGWSEVLVPAVVDQRTNTVEKPVAREIYRTRAKEDIQVTFQGGVVIAVKSVPKR